MSQCRAATRHPEIGYERKPRRHALAELQRLSKLAPEVLRANRVRSSLGPGAQPVPQALSLIELFRDAGKKGLAPEDYDASRWEERIRALQASSSGPAVARFDVALTVCTMRYVSDLRTGRINPQHFKFDLSVEQKKYDLAQFLRDRIMTTSKLQAVLDEVEPPFAGYRRTEQALERYIELARTDDGEKLPNVTKPIDPGQSYSGAARLARFLRLVDDLPANATLPGDAQSYGGPLVDAVKRFPAPARPR
jgi:L,D-transpeptidase YcbB